MDDKRTYQDPDTTHPASQACFNCHKIACIVRNWPKFRIEENPRGHRIGRWRDIENAKDCVSCQSLVRLFSTQAYYDASVIISSGDNEASSDSGCLIIRLRDETADPTRLETTAYKMVLIPSEVVEDCGRHFIRADPGWISIERINHWIRDCGFTHQSTCTESQLGNSEAPAEVMFIDVQRNCLVPGHTNQFQIYVALSYVWGQQLNIFQTTRANLRILLQQGSLLNAWDRIPATIQDAIILIRSLDIRYLWVDRLCIVQDDEASIEGNIAQMASIYARSYFTIIATEGDSGTGISGVQGGSKPRCIGQELVEFDDLCFLAIERYEFWGDEDALTQEVHFRGAYEIEQKRSWHKRAWTFQERVVSRRCLVFNNDTVYWECGGGIWSELLSSPHILARDLTSHNRKFGGPQWRITQKLWPDAAHYFRLCAQFSKRQLTYAGDALKAFSAIIHTFAPSFPGGFFYALPEFLLDLSLLWTFVVPHNKRREMFPSWSWIAWEDQGYGDSGISFSDAIDDCWPPTFTSEELRIFRRPLNIWRKKSTVTGRMEEIKNDYHIWQNAEDDKVGELPGWKSSQQPEKYTLEEVGMDQIAGFSGGRNPHPVPLDTRTSVQPLSSYMWEPFLYSRVQTATFRFAGLPDPNWGTVGLIDNEGTGVGNLRPHDDGVEREHLGNTGRECCLMAVCEATIPRWSEFVRSIHFNSKSHWDANNLTYPGVKDGLTFKWIDVLWIERKGSIAYRRGVGKVWLDAWERGSPEEGNIILGCRQAFDCKVSPTPERPSSHDVEGRVSTRVIPYSTSMSQVRRGMSAIRNKSKSSCS
ncbi:HET-domain-containing protein [Lindgomyces ingoldianus]|uniref:HET-domain-containing protein n=1 Tax=Lindgomyces ingoldianus TaxID=673940 RepID=A0ACB6Q8Q3_9PLEO|nr:HET-domain-containing protein [Lindgomyces ingoldianus]KAF2462561.1 HET-domain-containing protein [Lindgomyces ingoldianus]